jgi:F0F1-type ATP synthase membrane subunit b/b'
MKLEHHFIDIFVLVSGTFSILTALPLVYLALRSVTDTRKLRLIQHELAVVMRETKEIGQDVHEVQREIRHEQDEAKSGIDQTRERVESVSETVEQVAEKVAEATLSRRRLPLPRRLQRRRRSQAQPLRPS